MSELKQIQVLNAGPHYIKNRAVDPKRPKGKTGLKKIFVGGINGDLSKEEIKSYFEKFGNVSPLTEFACFS